MGSNEVHPQSISFHPSCWVLTWFGFRLINRFGKMEFRRGGQMRKSTQNRMHLFPTIVSRRSLPRNLVPRMLSCRNSSPSFRVPLASRAAITAAVPEPHGDLVFFVSGNMRHSSLPVQHGCEGVRPVPIQLTVGHNDCVGCGRS